MSGRVASAIDSVTNAVLIAGVEGEDAALAFTPGQYPLKLLPSLIHEATHFDTFSTPVGAAISILNMRAWSRLSRARMKVEPSASPEEAIKGLRAKYSDPDRSDLRALSDYIKCRVVEKTLLPFVEGLALFMEFDALPFGQRLSTLPTLAVDLCREYNRHDENSRENSKENCLNVLMSARFEPCFVTRKENLLMQPWDPGINPYLPGYIFVKGVRNALIGEHRSLVDGDLFFNCLKTIVFGDMRLARLLLDDTVSDGADACIVRIQQRIRLLFTDLNEELIRRVAEHSAFGSVGSWTEFQIGDSVGTAKDDFAIVEGAIGRLCDYPPSDELERELQETCMRILQNRQNLCLASFSGSIEVNAHGRCLIGMEQLKHRPVPLPLASGPALPGCRSACNIDPLSRGIGVQN